MWRRTRAPRGTCGASGAGASSSSWLPSEPHMARTASAVSGSRSTKRRPNSPPRASWFFQITSPSATTSAPMPSKRQTSLSPIAGRYAVRRRMPSGETSMDSASKPPPAISPTATSASKWTR